MTESEARTALESPAGSSLLARMDALERVMEAAKVMRDSFVALCCAVARHPDCVKILDDAEADKRCVKGSPKDFQDALTALDNIKSNG